MIEETAAALSTEARGGSICPAAVGAPLLLLPFLHESSLT